MKGWSLRTIEEGLPPRRYLIAFVSLFAMVTFADWGIAALVNWRVGMWLDPALKEGLQPIGAHNMAMLIGLAFLAGWRATSFNPAFDEKYRHWLATTPWTAAKPLPMGTSQLRWQDAVLVLLALSIWTFPGERISKLAVVLAFALSYSGWMMSALWTAGQLWSLCGAAALGFALLLTVGQSAWQTAVVAIGLCIYCDWSFRRALWRFPWDDSKEWFKGRLHSDLPNFWPQLCDRGIVAYEPLIPWRWAGALSVLGGCAAATLVELCTLGLNDVVGADDIRGGSWKFLAAFSFFFAIGRWAWYADGHSSPLGLWARMRLGRWIIPRHDYVYLAPLATLGVGIVLPWALFRAGAPAPLMALVTVTAVMLTALGAPPTFAEWSLTGEHRLHVRRPGLRKEWVQAG